MSSPYASPATPSRDEKITLPVWEHAVFGVVVLGSIVYAAVCGLRIYTLNTVVHLANQAAAGNPASSADAYSKTHLDLEVATAVMATFFGMYIVFIIWMFVLSARFRDAGQAGALRRLPAWIAWRIGLIVSILVAISVGASGSLDSAAGAHKEMLYMGVRMVIGCLYVWCAFSMRQAALSLRVNAMAARPAYTGQPPYPGQPYPGQPFPNQPFPNQPYPNQAYPNQAYPNQAYPGQPYPGQPLPAQAYPGQPVPNRAYSGESFSAQPMPGQSYPGQPFPNQQFPGQQFPGQPFSGPATGQPFPGQPATRYQFPGQPATGQTWPPPPPSGSPAAPNPAPLAGPSDAAPTE